MKMTMGWETISFTAAFPGWRALYYESPQEPLTLPLAGWMLQREIQADAITRDLIGDNDCPDERVVPGVLWDGEFEVEPAHNDPQFWCILSPTQSDPTVEEVGRTYALFAKMQAQQEQSDKAKREIKEKL